MENYLLYDEIGAAAGKTVYKGRRRGTIQFHGLHKWNKRWKQLVTNEASRRDKEVALVSLATVSSLRSPGSFAAVSAASQRPSVQRVVRDVQARLGGH